MTAFQRRDGESARAWVGRLRYADVLAVSAVAQDDLHAQRGLAAAAAEEEEGRQATLARSAEESEALRGCKAAVRALTPADRLALLHWLADDMRG